MSWRINIFFVSLFFLIVLILIIKSKSKDDKLKESHKYTVGFYEDTYFTGRSSRQHIKYYFYIDNIKYHGDDSYPQTPKIHLRKDEPILVMYFPLNPKINKVVFGFTIPESTINIPRQGWDTIPFERNGEIYNK